MNKNETDHSITSEKKKKVSSDKKSGSMTFTLKNCFSISSAILDIPKASSCTIITGENGCGKTITIKLLKFILDSILCNDLSEKRFKFLKKLWDEMIKPFLMKAGFSWVKSEENDFWKLANYEFHQNRISYKGSILMLDEYFGCFPLVKAIGNKIPKAFVSKVFERIKQTKFVIDKLEKIFSKKVSKENVKHFFASFCSGRKRGAFFKSLGNEAEVQISSKRTSYFLWKKGTLEKWQQIPFLKRAIILPENFQNFLDEIFLSDDGFWLTLFGEKIFLNESFRKSSQILDFSIYFPRMKFGKLIFLAGFSASEWLYSLGKYKIRLKTCSLGFKIFAWLSILDYFGLLFPGTILCLDADSISKLCPTWKNEFLRFLAKKIKINRISVCMSIANVSEIFDGLKDVFKTEWKLSYSIYKFEKNSKKIEKFGEPFQYTLKKIVE